MEKQTEETPIQTIIDPNDKILNLVIDKKLSQTRTIIVEKQLNTLVLVISFGFIIFGLLVPMFQINQLTDRVEKNIDKMNDSNKELQRDNAAKFNEMKGATYSAIAKMESNFRELSGNQLRRPYMEGFYGELKLNGVTIQTYAYEEDKPRMSLIKFVNIGDASARNVKFHFYSNIEVSFYSFITQQQIEYVNSDESSYKYKYQLYMPSYDIDPKDNSTFNIILNAQPPDSLLNTIHPVLVKIYFEQPEPSRIIFNIRLAK